MTNIMMYIQAIVRKWIMHSRSGFTVSTLLILAMLPAIPALQGCAPEVGAANEQGLELLNVSYDPTRELWNDINEQFIRQHQKDSGRKLTINQSHGGSGSQAR